MFGPSRPQGLTFSALDGVADRTMFNDVVKVQMETIDSMIIEANSQGMSIIKYCLPINFMIRNTTQSDGQIMVYERLLKLYRTPESQGGKGFPNTWIDFTLETKPPMFCVKWEKGLDPTDKKNKLSYIRSSPKQT